MSQGKIIEYIDQGKFICTLCIQDKGNRLHLLTPSNKEVNLSVKRALLISDSHIDPQKSREELLSRLGEADERREQLKNQVNVRELWELVRDESERFNHKYLTKLCFGETAGDEHLSALVRALFEDRLYFKMKDGQFLPNSEEKVEEIVRQREEEAQREELFSKGGAWLRKVKQGGKPSDPDCKEEVIRLLSELALYGNDAPNYKVGKELLARAEVTDTREARNLLVKGGVWDEDENLDLHRLGIKEAFSPLEVEESRRLARVAAGAEGREDLRDLSILTIDGLQTRDFDDAVSLEVSGDTFELGVHIADVGAAIPPGSVLDKTAAERGSSLYLPRHHVPMIPRELSEDALSLKGGSDRLAISLLAHLDGKGSVLEYRFTPSVIRIRQNLTYDGVNETLKDETVLGEMYRLSLLLQEKRMEQGGLRLSVPELEVRFNGNGFPNLELLPQDTPSRMVIAEFMILYNWLAASFCRENGIPILYRTQAEPSERLMPSEESSLYYVFQQRRKLSPLSIDTSPKPHSSLGLDAYTHSTSPIRRYLDLLVQRQLGHFLMGKERVYDEKRLDDIRMAVEPVLKGLMNVKRNRIRYWILKFLRQHRGEKYEAMVLYELKSRYRILLTDFLLVTDLKREPQMRLNPAERFLVEVRKADPWEDTLELSYSGPLD
jgi:exoribonuclease-2